MKPLLPIRHSKLEFFDCNIFDVLRYFKDDMASMEHPFFSLSTRPDMRELHYEHNGNTITIKPSADGLVTIHDKDILLYCASHLRRAINEGDTPSQIIRFTAHDFFVSTNRGTSGQYYKNFETSLNRLRGTTINTNIKIKGESFKAGFGLIDSWRIIEKSPDNDRMVAVEIKLSDWFYKAIIANQLLTISRDYFLLRKPLERRIYELARKHCGDSKEFHVGLQKLHIKIGTTAPLFKFRAAFREIAKTNNLPDYKISLLDDVVTFTNRRKNAREGNVRLPRLKTETFEKAKRAAPGWDVYYLEIKWREWIAGKEKPNNPDAAFIAFCSKKYQREGRP
jgi:plasmid replication initiation protein